MGGKVVKPSSQNTQTSLKKEILLVTKNNIEEVIKEKIQQFLAIEMDFSYTETYEYLNGIKRILKNYRQLQSLKFHLSKCKFTDEEARSLIKTLSILKSLKNLFICINNGYPSLILIEEVGYILKQSFNLLFLELNFSQCKVTDSCIKNFSIGLQTQKKIKELNITLSQNKIGNEGFKDIILGIQNMKDLLVLKIDLSDNSIDLDTPQLFQSVVENNPNISNLQLFLANNSLNHQGFIDLMCDIAKLDNIQTLILQLDNCALTSQMFKSIQLYIQYFKFLKNFDLFVSKNNLSNMDMKNFFQDGKNSLERIENLSLNFK
ncbi:hypothetical protein TTHERM_00429710 (macronuclear) [Tetrahymena thermophila SB210]|uniref:Kinase domain protein n=1 Tax=Tetrahymena thermophila (strain SB210) TaxID=312017 RepID=Q231I8_TETTS|nr:hypothetical protein TTHERM_00429710 [Tetrahymena thermophila SB210]EAR91051.2 hypothetical protein TTHERM_00429710 [Tetrahymena thermophila SB210]|eukprot:XP_001011296.2 hypothetical protein TTHERM_00429710 [Tetrahymena thermophila SB210]